MKNLKNLNGAKALSKSEQKSINGGRRLCEIQAFEKACTTNNDCKAWWGNNGPAVCSVNGFCTC